MGVFRTRIARSLESFGKMDWQKMKLKVYPLKGYTSNLVLCFKKLKRDRFVREWSKSKQRHPDYHGAFTPTRLVWLKQTPGPFTR